MALAAGLDATSANTAASLAVNTPWLQARTSDSTAHPLGIQTLSVERQESKSGSAANMLRVYQFHYELQQARLVAIDSSTETVVDTQLINSVHLPLNTTEIAYAIAMLETDSAIVNQLRDEQTMRGGNTFASLAELDVKASIYEPLQHEHICQRQRCALLSLFDDTNTVFSTEPVVNLQTLQLGLLVTR